MSKSKGINLSLFERLCRQNLKKQPLTIQYSMNPSIVSFPSIKFYGGMIESGIGQDQAPQISGFPWPLPELNVAFVNVNGVEESIGGSYSNEM